MIQHFAQKALILDDTGEKVLLNKYTSSKYLGSKLTGKYCLPGGRVDKGEDPDKSLKREVIEETGGLDIEQVVPVYRFSWIYEKDGQDNQIICVVFLCKKVGGEIGLPTDEGETTISKSEWVDLHDVNAQNMVFDELPAIAKYLKYRNSNPFANI